MNKLTTFSRAILAIAIMLCVALPTLAHDFEVGGIYYYYLDKTAKTVAVTYRGSSYSDYTNEYTGRITIPSSVTYNGVTYSVSRIGNSAFSGCSGMTSVTIPNSVTKIGNYAFRDCSGLTEVTIGNSVTSIGSGAFEGAAWYNNLADGVIYINNVLYKYKGNMPNGTSISVKDGTVSISPSAFSGCDGLTLVTIPNSVTSIGYYAFEDCTGLTSITIPNSVTSIGTSAFFGCTGLTSITIPNSVTSIGVYAFWGCRGLTEATIGNSVTTIGRSAFYNCTGLTSVTIGNSVNEIGSEAFVNCGLRLIMSHCAVPPTCDGAVFGGDENNDSYRALLMIPEGSLIDYANADEWHKFTQVHEVSEATVSTQEKNATFEIPTIEGATKYEVTVYTDITMTQLVATTHYDATGKIIPMSTTLELSIDGFEDGVYYYKVLVKSADGEVLNNYIGTFEIDAAGVENIANDSAIEVARYDIHGRLLSEPTKGLNIIKMSDGTTRKEIVK